MSRIYNFTRIYHLFFTNLHSNFKFIYLKIYHNLPQNYEIFESEIFAGNLILELYLKFPAHPTSTFRRIVASTCATLVGTRSKIVSRWRLRSRGRKTLEATSCQSGASTTCGWNLAIVLSTLVSRRTTIIRNLWKIWTRGSGWRPF